MKEITKNKPSTNIGEKGEQSTKSTKCWVKKNDEMKGLRYTWQWSELKLKLIFAYLQMRLIYYTGTICFTFFSLTALLVYIFLPKPNLYPSDLYGFSSLCYRLVGMTSWVIWSVPHFQVLSHKLKYLHLFKRSLIENFQNLVSLIVIMPISSYCIPLFALKFPHLFFCPLLQLPLFLLLSSISPLTSHKHCFPFSFIVEWLPIECTLHFLGGWLSWLWSSTCEESLSLNHGNI